jgi:hypothetical protein
MKVPNVFLIFILALFSVKSASIFSADMVAETLFTIEKLDDDGGRGAKKFVKEAKTLDSNEVHVSIPQDKLPVSIRRNSYTAVQNFISKDTSTEITRMLEQDHKDNVSDLIQYRWVFRKFANITEVFGNGLLYLGTGLNTIAAGITMVGSQQTANIILFVGTACVAGHVTFLGLAKCSAREQGEREIQLESLANAVGFQITPLKPEITDDEDEENLADKKRKSNLRKRVTLVEDK